MSASPIRLGVLDALMRRPSRASAASIGQHFILNGAPPALRVRGLDAIGKMPCDWTVAILEMAINERRLGHLVRRNAINKLQELLLQAIDLGYCAVTQDECRQLTEAAQEILKAQDRIGEQGEIGAVEDLCGHLSQAVADGAFEQLPDF